MAYGASPHYMPGLLKLFGEEPSKWKTSAATENKLRPSFVAVRRHQAPFGCELPLIRQGYALPPSPPRGGRLDIRRNFNLTSIGSHRLATFPVTVGFFAFSPLGEKAKKGKARVYHRQKLKIQTISDSPLRNRRSLPKGESKESGEVNCFLRRISFYRKPHVLCTRESAQGLRSANFHTRHG